MGLAGLLQKRDFLFGTSKNYVYFCIVKAENLKEKTSTGLFWAFVNNGATQLLNLAVGIFMARLLSPADYGIVGVLALFGSIAMCLQTSGFSQALINLKHPTANDYNSVFWFNITVSIVLYLILFCCAPLIAHFFKQPCLVSVSRVLFLTLPVYAMGVASQAYLVKNMMNRQIAYISIVSLVCSGMVGVAMAFGGHGYWALVGQQLTSAVITVVGRYFAISWRPALTVDFKPVASMFRFSVNLLFTNMVNIINFNLSTFIFGRLLPIKTVGYYSQATKWNNLAEATIDGAIGQVSQTILVSVSNEQEREVRVFRKMLRFTAFLSFPALFGLSLIAREFILVTIGPEWLPSIPLLQILCIGGAFMPFYMLYQTVAISAGRSDIYLWCQTGQVAIQLLLILLLFPYGIKAIVTGTAVLTIALLAVWQAIAHKLIGVRWREVAADVLPFCLTAFGVMIITWLLTSPISLLPLLLVARIIVAALLYSAIMKLLHVDVMDECISFLFKKKR